MSKNKKPRKWTEVYPQGTTAGNEEQKFFIALARSKFEWRSVKALAKESGLAVERVEEILQKYYKKGMVYQSPKNEDNWGYWERVPEMLDGDDASLTKADQNDRIDKAMGVVAKAPPAKKASPASSAVPVSAKKKAIP